MSLVWPRSPHNRQNKNILPPYPNSVPFPYLQVSFPLNAWFQQSHGAKEGRLILWPSCLTKQILYFSWERKKSSRHLGRQTLRETHPESGTHTYTDTHTDIRELNCYLILKYNYFKNIEQFLLSSIP